MAQLLVSLAVAAVVLPMAGLRPAYSAFVGGLVNVLASFYLATRLYKIGAVAEPGRFLRALYVGETIKLLLTAALFAIVIVGLKVQALYTLIGYILSLSAYWFALLISAQDDTNLNKR